jgi:cytochrome oxidase Cu insertion factor (SCO1/SenC/PrrC family)
MEKSAPHVSIVAERPADLERDRQVREYNYEHFRTRHYLADLRLLARGEGVRPGHEAPDFELESTIGERVRLSALRGKPVVLRFASFT